MVAVVELGVPFAVIDEGVNVQLDSEGKPEHASVIVPLKLVELETLTDELADSPGIETITVDCAAGTVAKNPGVIVKLTGAVVLLGLKLGSPL
jgi:hypothetical protein